MHSEAYTSLGDREMRATYELTNALFIPKNKFLCWLKG